MSERSSDHPARKCPVCGKAQTDAFKPFCSKRCADVDLSRWLKGTYTIPTEEDSESPADDDEDAE